MTELVDLVPEGDGPFVIPLLAKFVAIQNPKDKMFVMAECQFEDGTKLLVPIERHCAEAFAECCLVLKHTLDAPIPGAEKGKH